MVTPCRKGLLGGKRRFRGAEKEDSLVSYNGNRLCANCKHAYPARYQETLFRASAGAAAGAPAGAAVAVAGSIAVEALIVHPCRARTYLEGEGAGGKGAGSGHEAGRILRAALGADNDIVIVKGQIFEGVLAFSAFKVVKRHGRTPHAKLESRAFSLFVR
jgi:hypothetical protein